MSSTQTIDRIAYPETDGKPMGETDVHINWMIRIRDILKYRYRDQQVYVASNLLVYYEEGLPQKFVVPDDFVVLDSDPGERRTFKIWEEKRTPDVVFEVTSLSSRRDDQELKPQIYSRIGVREYFLYDPTDEYLNPALQGLRFEGDDCVRIEPDEFGRLQSQSLQISLHLGDGKLVFTDVQTGQVLPTEAEAERSARAAETAARQAAESARAAETAARQAAESRADQLEAELQRLRDASGPKRK